MVDNVSFIESISGIQYPEIIVNFFDHFMVLKQIVENSGIVSVISNTENSILFLVEFNSSDAKDQALKSIPEYYTIYGRQIIVGIEVLTDRIVQFQLN